jgi:flagella basal body P-ring formation protein FlgA
VKLFFFLLIFGAPVAFAHCLPVSGGTILARDLVPADPRYAALPATLIIGYAPNPGAQRVLAGAELGRIARANGLVLPGVADVCFEVPLRQLTRDEIVAGLRRSLPAGANLEVMESASLAVPAGELEFPVTGLEPAPPGGSGTQLWRGFVHYAENRRAPFWVRVAVTVPYTAVIAARDLTPDSPIAEEALRVETLIGPLRPDPPVSRIEEVRGRGVRVPLKAGSVIPRALLSDLPAVRRGDPVRVEVRSGLARLHFDAVAESAAREGEFVVLRNPLSGKTFRARLESRSAATLILGAGQKL